MKTHGNMYMHLYEFPVMHKIWSMDDAPNDMDKRVATDKWDGHTCSLRYVDGKLMQVLSQGDGIFGSDVTKVARQFVPDAIALDGEVQVTGEMAASTNVPSDALHILLGEKTGELEFVAFDVQPHPFPFWSDCLKLLVEQDFLTVLTHRRDEYPKDGVVYRINNNAEFASTQKGMIALKYYP